MGFSVTLSMRSRRRTHDLCGSSESTRCGHLEPSRT
jgi:hypothetical protein